MSSYSAAANGQEPGSFVGKFSVILKRIHLGISSTLQPDVHSMLLITAARWLGEDDSLCEHNSAFAKEGRSHVSYRNIIVTVDDAFRSVNSDTFRH